MKLPRDKLKPLDYAVMFGGPIAFLVIFWLGVRLIAGPTPEASPVKKLRDGEIEIGAKMSDVQKELGRPSKVQEMADGSYRLVYTRTVFDPSTKGDSLDEAVIEFTPTGRVARITFDSNTTPPPQTDK
ncbi:MAG: hypothetical protein H7Y17_14725 [Chlorobia bacterium]|nr:hypothetical protein [Fimbriimonadaceae bacterium]